MDPVVERVRELAIEEIDRQEDIDRVVNSGPWPALIWEDYLLFPSVLVKLSPFPWDIVREETVRAMTRTRAFQESSSRILEAFRELASAKEVFSVRYESMTAQPFIAGSGSRLNVLVNAEQERARMDPFGLFGSGDGKKVLSLKPSAEIRRALDEVARAVDERRDAKDAARFQRRTALVRWRKERCVELSVRLQSDGLTCPRCRTPSRSHQLVTSFFICGSCGCSFRPEELPGEIPPA